MIDHKSTRTAVSHIPDNTPPYLFILIHGTWAQNAQWCQDDSELCRSLKAAFPNAILYRFPWTGGNSVRARINATEKLAVELKDLCVKYPEALHFILAHSHAGNIACYALRDHPELQERIAGIVSLSTPFLHVQIRYLSPIVRFIWIILSSIGLSLILSTLIYVVLLYLLNGFQNIESTEILYVSLYVVMLVSLLIWLPTRFRNTCHEVQRAMQLPSELLPQFLIVRTAADEASAALTMCHVGTWLMDKSLAVMLFPVTAGEWLGRKVSQGVNHVLQRCLGLRNPLLGNNKVGSAVRYLSYYSLFLAYFLGMARSCQ